MAICGTPRRKITWSLIPPAAEVVRRIFQMIAEGLSAVQTAKILNQECVPTPMLYKQAQSSIPRHWNTLYEENFWTDSAIIRIVRDEQYLGKVVYGKRFYYLREKY